MIAYSGTLNLPSSYLTGFFVTSISIEDFFKTMIGQLS